MIEYEKKIMLTADEYAALLLVSDPSASVMNQTNYYFDTEDHAMDRMGITCRIRARNGRFKATIKTHGSASRDCSTEEVLEEKSTFDPTVFRPLDVHCQGALVTERAVLYKDGFCEAVLDRNTYLGFTDYELEIEYLSGNEDKAFGLLYRIANVLKASSANTDPAEFLSRTGMPKSERFFARMREQKGGD